MMIARWTIDARFGHKQAEIDATKKWCRDVGAQIGWTADKLRLLTGSVGAPESTVVLEWSVKDLVELNTSWEKLATVKAHKQWSKEIEAQSSVREQQVGGLPSSIVFEGIDASGRRTTSPHIAARHQETVGNFGGVRRSSACARVHGLAAALENKPASQRFFEEAKLFLCR